MRRCGLNAKGWSRFAKWSLVAVFSAQATIFAVFGFGVIGIGVIGWAYSKFEGHGMSVGGIIAVGTLAGAGLIVALANAASAYEVSRKESLLVSPIRLIAIGSSLALLFAACVWAAQGFSA
jgi:hypothetical protein